MKYEFPPLNEQRKETWHEKKVLGFFLLCIAVLMAAVLCGCQSVTPEFRTLPMTAALAEADALRLRSEKLKSQAEFVAQVQARQTEHAGTPTERSGVAEMLKTRVVEKQMAPPPVQMVVTGPEIPPTPRWVKWDPSPNAQRHDLVASPAGLSQATNVIQGLRTNKVPYEGWWYAAVLAMTTNASGPVNTAAAFWHRVDIARTPTATTLRFVPLYGGLTRVEASPDLKVWTPVQTVSGRDLTNVVELTTAAKRYYRLRHVNSP